MMKYVLVSGGVVSGLGKGVLASSIGVVLKSCGLRVTAIKIDPYLNTDAGTMSPFEHGEVFVLDDGGEVDLDLGNYERFLDVKLTCDNNITTGKIYQSVIDKERKGDYLGKTVQVVPHITDAIQEWIERVAMIPVDGEKGPADVCVIELGGTIGDIESMPFVEALRQLSNRVGSGNFCLVHVSLVPVVSAVGEQKTKPTQHSVQELRGFGLVPNILACRSFKVSLCLSLSAALRCRCSIMIVEIEVIYILTYTYISVTNIANNILTIYDVSNIWHIPLLLRDQKAHEAILKALNLICDAKKPALEQWAARAERCDEFSSPVRIAMVGKYTGLSDAYLSVLKALLHASVECSRKLVVEWIAATDLEDATARKAPDAYEAAWNVLKNVDGILVPGGFGDRGVQGKILAAKYARENQVPYLGICLGMQIAVIEFARSILGLQDANSTEFDPDTKCPCVIFMPEVNPDMIDKLECAGLSFVGKDESGKRMEIIELPSHPFFVGVQFHPEFKSRPGKPSAVFLGLIRAATGDLFTHAQLPTQFNNMAAKSSLSNGMQAKIKAFMNGSAKSSLKTSLFSNANGIRT
ncbi:CTP synthase [Nymphaea thermarum]|nr:CTP synthase [Nymphaea thermarum]